MTEQMYQDAQPAPPNPDASAGTSTTSMPELRGMTYDQQMSVLSPMSGGYPSENDYSMTRRELNREIAGQSYDNYPILPGEVPRLPPDVPADDAAMSTMDDVRRSSWPELGMPDFTPAQGWGAGDPRHLNGDGSREGSTTSRSGRHTPSDQDGPWQQSLTGTVERQGDEVRVRAGSEARHSDGSRHSGGVIVGTDGVGGEFSTVNSSGNGGQGRAVLGTDRQEAHLGVQVTDSDTGRRTQVQGGGFHHQDADGGETVGVSAGVTRTQEGRTRGVGVEASVSTDADGNLDAVYAQVTAPVGPVQLRIAGGFAVEVSEVEHLGPNRYAVTARRTHRAGVGMGGRTQRGQVSADWDWTGATWQRHVFGSRSEAAEWREEPDYSALERLDGAEDALALDEDEQVGLSEDVSLRLGVSGRSGPFSLGFSFTTNEQTEVLVTRMEGTDVELAISLSAERIRRLTLSLGGLFSIGLTDSGGDERQLTMRFDLAQEAAIEEFEHLLYCHEHLDEVVEASASGEGLPSGVTVVGWRDEDMRGGGLQLGAMGQTFAMGGSQTDIEGVDERGEYRGNAGGTRDTLGSNSRSTELEILDYDDGTEVTIDHEVDLNRVGATAEGLGDILGMSPGESITSRERTDHAWTVATSIEGRDLQRLVEWVQARGRTLPTPGSAGGYGEHLDRLERQLTRADGDADATREALTEFMRSCGPRGSEILQDLLELIGAGHEVSFEHDIAVDGRHLPGGATADRAHETQVSRLRQSIEDPGTSTEDVRETIFAAMEDAEQWRDDLQSNAYPELPREATREAAEAAEEYIAGYQALLADLAARPTMSQGPQEQPEMTEPLMSTEDGMSMMPEDASVLELADRVEAVELAQAAGQRAGSARYLATQRKACLEGAEERLSMAGTLVWPMARESVARGDSRFIDGETAWAMAEFQLRQLHSEARAYQDNVATWDSAEARNHLDNAMWRADDALAVYQEAAFYYGDARDAYGEVHDRLVDVAPEVFETWEAEPDL